MSVPFNNLNDDQKTNDHNNTTTDYVSSCLNCKQKGIGHSNINKQFICNSCWSLRKPMIQANINLNINYPKITNYYSIPLCLKKHLTQKTFINISNGFKLYKPNIYQLFNKYNYLFFDNKLKNIQLRWNKREKLNAGYCFYDSTNNKCIIELSYLLLQFRSSKDLIETLIHEMIHSYLFIKKLNYDRTDHGCRYLSIMNVINYICNKSNLNVTVRHNFYNEIELNKSHKWKCNGICGNIIYRPIYRPPGLNEHRGYCNGTYEIIKINETKHKLTSDEWKQKKLLKKKQKQQIRDRDKLNNNNDNLNEWKRNKKKYKRNNSNQNLLLQFVNCPNCSISIHKHMLDEHLNDCLI